MGMTKLSTTVFDPRTVCFIVSRYTVYVLTAATLSDDKKLLLEEGGISAK
jgi:hypothetical protein